MNIIMLPGQTDTPARPLGSPMAEGYHLNVALVYQDSLTQRWAEEVRDFVAQQAGEGVVQTTEWLADHLSGAAAFTQGIQALARADAIVIAVKETRRLPGEFYLWVNLWLQVRAGKPGALVALIGRSGRQDADWRETRRYLHAVAGQGGLELFVKECGPVVSPARIAPDDLSPLARAA